MEFFIFLATNLVLFLFLFVMMVSFTNFAKLLMTLRLAIRQNNAPNQSHKKSCGKLEVMIACCTCFWDECEEHKQINLWPITESSAGELRLSMLFELKSK